MQLPPRAIVGMVHLEPLPGTPRSTLPLDEIVRRAVADAEALRAGGADAVLVENFGDTPFAKRIGPEGVAALTIAVQEVVRAVPLPVGVNALRNDAPAALAVAHATGARFVRCNVWSGVAHTDQGVVEGIARETLDLRRRLGAQVQCWADARVKHASHPGTLEQGLVDNARNGCDAHIVSGTRTGAPPEPEEVARAKGLAALPVVVGSGITSANLASFAAADAFIVGTSLKRRGRIDAALVGALVEARDVLTSRARSAGGAAPPTRPGPRRRR
jgi:uncharacterized protein